METFMGVLFLQQIGGFILAFPFCVALIAICIVAPLFGLVLQMLTYADNLPSIGGIVYKLTGRPYDSGEIVALLAIAAFAAIAMYAGASFIFA